MAEEKKQAPVDEKKKGTADESGELLLDEQKKGKPKFILYILIAVIVAGLGAGYYFFGSKLVQKYLKKQPVAEEQDAGNGEDAEGGAEEDEDPGEGEKKEGVKDLKEAKKTVGPILALDPFVFNMSGNQSKYAKVTLGIECKDPKVMEEVKKMTPVVRDKILSILGTKTPEALMDVTKRDALKNEIRSSLKVLFKEEDELQAVYITDIIIQ